MSASGFRNDIQGLRAIAVIAVMAFHYNPAWLPGGFIGVDVFLVISGFLITSILLARKAEEDYTPSATLKYFYISRFKRIAPAYFAMLVLAALVAAVFFLPNDFDTFKDGLEQAAWFNSNNYFAEFGNYFAPANHEQPLLHTWSLAVEVQFYLLAPFVILLLPIKALKWALGALLAGFTLLAEYRMRVVGIEQATYYSLYARLPEFFAGCLAAIYMSNMQKLDERIHWPAYLGLVLIFSAAIAQPSLGKFPGIPTLVPVAGSVLLLIKPAEGILRRFLCSKLLVWIGALSYSLYLWHWPVLAFLRYYTGTEVLDLAFSLVFVVLTLGLSVVSYYGIEQAFKGKQTLAVQALRWSVLLIAILGTSQSMARVNTAFTPPHLPIEYRRYADLETICHGKIITDCFRGDLSSEREVLVLGDSHAAMLNLFFDSLGKELGFKARIITASSCVTIPGFDYQRIAEWAHQPCLDQIEAAMPFIEEAQTIFIAGVWNRQTRSKAFNAALSQFVESQNSKQIFLLSQVPRFKRDVSRLRRFDSLGLPNQPERDFSYIVANQRLRELALNSSDAEFLALDSLPMFGGAPFHEGRLIYFDEHHLNEYGSREYAHNAEAIFEGLLKRKGSESSE